MYADCAHTKNFIEAFEFEGNDRIQMGLEIPRSCVTRDLSIFYDRAISHNFEPPFLVSIFYQSVKPIELIVLDIDIGAVVHRSRYGAPNEKLLVNHATDRTVEFSSRIREKNTEEGIQKSRLLCTNCPLKRELAWMYLITVSLYVEANELLLTVSVRAHRKITTRK